MELCDTHIDINQWAAGKTLMLDDIQESASLDRSLDLGAQFELALPLPQDLELHFGAALRHLLRNPGSMVRPKLVYQVAEAYGFSTHSAHELAIALEYFHTASLVFDDLPCMDNATARRGAPCVHVPFGEASAILAALALINRAYSLTWRAIAHCPRSIQTRAIDYLEQRLGVNGLLNGQSMDLNYARLPHDRETTEKVACGKTVSLIRLTLVLPAILGAASSREIQLMERVALCWGLGYQMVDDLKDVLQTSSESGKTAARDLDLDRPNIAHAIGIRPAVARLTRLIHAGDRTLDHLLELKPALAFLGRLRTDLEAELNRVTENAARFPA